MLKAAEKILKIGCRQVLIKGGHGTAAHSTESQDLLWDGKEVFYFTAPRIQTKNTHGTGCTLSSAIACNLANGYNIAESVRAAKKYISGALEAGLDLGKGSGPLNHFYALQSLVK